MLAYHPFRCRSVTEEALSESSSRQSNMLPAYLYLEMVAEADDAVEYLAMSPDFSPDGSWQPVARISITKRDSTYAFEPIGAWAHEQILDPHFYEVEESDEERAARYRANFADHKNGAWTARIHGSVTRLIA